LQVRSFILLLEGIKTITTMEASAVRLHNDSHSERAEDAITQEAEHWTAGQMLEIILSEWADDEELLDIAQTLQVRRFECGMYDDKRNVVYPHKDSYINY
jgi:hypothetical protein